MPDPYQGLLQVGSSLEHVIDPLVSSGYFSKLSNLFGIRRDAFSHCIGAGETVFDVDYFLD